MRKMYVHTCENCGKQVDVTNALNKGQFFEICPYCNNKFKLHKKETQYTLGNNLNSIDDLNKIFENNDIQAWVDKEMKEIAKIN